MANKNLKRDKYETRVAGKTIYPDGKVEMILEKARPAKGFGRWIYCKYCYKKVNPMLSGINQIICSKCGSSLTPDFFSSENLVKWFEGDETALKKDLETPEAKKWLKKAREGKIQPWKIDYEKK
jgi:hypothetical protein